MVHWSSRGSGAVRGASIVRVCFMLAYLHGLRQDRRRRGCDRSGIVRSRGHEGAFGKCVGCGHCSIIFMVEASSDWRAGVYQNQNAISIAGHGEIHERRGHFHRFPPNGIRRQPLAADDPERVLVMMPPIGVIPSAIRGVEEIKALHCRTCSAGGQLSKTVCHVKRQIRYPV